MGSPDLVNGSGWSGLEHTGWWVKVVWQPCSVSAGRGGGGGTLGGTRASLHTPLTPTTGIGQACADASATATAVARAVASAIADAVSIATNGCAQAMSVTQASGVPSEHACGAGTMLTTVYTCPLA